MSRIEFTCFLYGKVTLLSLLIMVALLMPIKLDVCFVEIWQNLDNFFSGWEMFLFRRKGILKSHGFVAV